MDQSEKQQTPESSEEAATVQLVDKSLLPASEALATINRDIQADMRTLNSWGSIMEKTADTFEQALFRVDTVLRIIYRHCPRIIINPEHYQFQNMGDVLKQIDAMSVEAFKTGDYSEILRISTSGQFSRPGPRNNASPEAFAKLEKSSSSVSAHVSRYTCVRCPFVTDDELAKRA